MLTLASVLAWSLTACATRPAEPVAGRLSESTVTERARVEEVDLAGRRIKLRDSAGRSSWRTVPEEVRNLPQVRAGDEVVVTFFESVAYEVRKPGTASPGVVAAEGAHRARAGEKPGVGVGSVTTVTVTIESIDRDRSTVTLRKADGDSVTVRLQDRTKFDQIAVGDLVEITFTESLVASVQPAPRQ
jgi:hypothetical protein